MWNRSNQRINECLSSIKSWDETPIEKTKYLTRRYEWKTEFLI
jgi:hypothetical protein